MNSSTEIFGLLTTIREMWDKAFRYIKEISMNLCEVECIGCGVKTTVFEYRIDAAKDEHLLFHRNELDDRAPIDFVITPLEPGISGPVSS